ncbi:hypothetical protein [Ferrimonas pelagia]|uniref:Chromosome partition protein Smc n=1 Tax=Ferrimonas pelagia TaxID=1177826 RepID=A0ABP9ENM2_9GAMM
MDIFGTTSASIRKLSENNEQLWDAYDELKSETKSKLATTESDIAKLADDVDSIRKSAPEHYKEIEKNSRSITSLQTHIKRRSGEIAKDEKAAKESIASIEEIKEESQTISDSLKEQSETITTTASKIEEYNTQIESQLKTCNDLANKSVLLTQRLEELQSSIEEIESQSTDATSLIENIKNLRQQAVKERNEIRTSYEDIYGYETEDYNEHGELIKVKGKIEFLDESYKKIDNELSDLYEDNIKKSSNITKELHSISEGYESKFQQYISDCRSNYNKSKKQIDDLLPAALTAGLAAAYDKKIDDEIEQLKQHENSFQRSIYVLIAISLLPVLIIVFKNDGAFDLDTITKLIQGLSPLTLPLYAPVVWLAYSANKKYKLSKRLIEEYTHKGVLSKTFEGLSKQVQDIPEGDISHELRTKLLYNLVDVNSENPGKLISDYNKSDHPIMDVLDKSSQLADAMSKVSKIPGMQAITKRLGEKNKQLITDEDRKISTTIENMDESKIGDNKNTKPAQTEVA